MPEDFLAPEPPQQQPDPPATQQGGDDDYDVRGILDAGAREVYRLSSAKGQKIDLSEDEFADFISRTGGQESGFNPKARSYANAKGAMQVMDGTVRKHGLDPKDSNQTIVAGLLEQYENLSRVAKYTNGDKGLARLYAAGAYHAGPGRVFPNLEKGRRGLDAIDDVGDKFIKTRDYAKQVSGYKPGQVPAPSPLKITFQNKEGAEETLDVPEAELPEVESYLKGKGVKYSLNRGAVSSQETAGEGLDAPYVPQASSPKPDKKTAEMPAEFTPLKQLESGQFGDAKVQQKQPDGSVKGVRFADLVDEYNRKVNVYNNAYQGLTPDQYAYSRNIIGSQYKSLDEYRQALTGFIEQSDAESLQNPMQVRVPQGFQIKQGRTLTQADVTNPVTGATVNGLMARNGDVQKYARERSRIRVLDIPEDQKQARLAELNSMEESAKQVYAQVFEVTALQQARALTEGGEQPGFAGASEVDSRLAAKQVGEMAVGKYVASRLKSLVPTLRKNGVEGLPSDSDLVKMSPSKVLELYKQYYGDISQIQGYSREELIEEGLSRLPNGVRNAVIDPRLPGVGSDFAELVKEDPDFANSLRREFESWRAGESYKIFLKRKGQQEQSRDVLRQLEKPEVQELKKKVYDSPEDMERFYRSISINSPIRPGDAFEGQTIRDLATQATRTDLSPAELEAAQDKLGRAVMNASLRRIPGLSDPEIIKRFQNDAEFDDGQGGKLKGYRFSGATYAQAGAAYAPIIAETPDYGYVDVTQSGVAYKFKDLESFRKGGSPMSGDSAILDYQLGIDQPGLSAGLNLADRFNALAGREQYNTPQSLLPSGREDYAAKAFKDWLQSTNPGSGVVTLGTRKETVVPSQIQASSGGAVSTVPVTEDVKVQGFVNDDGSLNPKEAVREYYRTQGYTDTQLDDYEARVGPLFIRKADGTAYTDEELGRLYDPKKGTVAIPLGFRKLPVPESDVARYAVAPELQAKIDSGSVTAKDISGADGDYSPFLRDNLRRILAQNQIPMSPGLTQTIEELPAQILARDPVTRKMRTANDIVKELRETGTVRLNIPLPQVAAALARNERAARIQLSREKALGFGYDVGDLKGSPKSIALLESARQSATFNSFVERQVGGVFDFLSGGKEFSEGIDRDLRTQQLAPEVILPEGVAPDSSQGKKLLAEYQEVKSASSMVFELGKSLFIAAGPTRYLVSGLAPRVGLKAANILGQTITATLPEIITPDGYVFDRPTNTVVRAVYDRQTKQLRAETWKDLTKATAVQLATNPFLAAYQGVNPDLKKTLKSEFAFGFAQEALEGGNLPQSIGAGFLNAALEVGGDAAFKFSRKASRALSELSGQPPTPIDGQIYRAEAAGKPYFIMQTEGDEPGQITARLLTEKEAVKLKLIEAKPKDGQSKPITSLSLNKAEVDAPASSDIGMVGDAKRPPKYNVVDIGPLAAEQMLIRGGLPGATVDAEEAFVQTPSGVQIPKVLSISAESQRLLMMNGSVGAEGEYAFRRVEMTQAEAEKAGKEFTEEERAKVDGQAREDYARDVLRGMESGSAFSLDGVSYVVEADTSGGLVAIPLDRNNRPLAVLDEDLSPSLPTGRPLTLYSRPSAELQSGQKASELSGFPGLSIQTQEYAPIGGRIFDPDPRLIQNARNLYVFPQDVAQFIRAEALGMSQRGESSDAGDADVGLSQAKSILSSNPEGGSQKVRASILAESQSVEEIKRRNWSEAYEQSRLTDDEEERRRILDAARAKNEAVDAQFNDFKLGLGQSPSSIYRKEKRVAATASKKQSRIEGLLVKRTANESSPSAAGVEAEEIPSVPKQERGKTKEAQRNLFGSMPGAADADRPTRQVVQYADASAPPAVRREQNALQTVVQLAGIVREKFGDAVFASREYEFENAYGSKTNVRGIDPEIVSEPEIDIETGEVVDKGSFESATSSGAVIAPERVLSEAKTGSLLVIQYTSRAAETLGQDDEPNFKSKGRAVFMVAANDGQNVTVARMYARDSHKFTMSAGQSYFRSFTAKDLGKAFIKDGKPQSTGSLRVLGIGQPRTGLRNGDVFTQSATNVNYRVIGSTSDDQVRMIEVDDAGLPVRNGWFSATDLSVAKSELSSSDWIQRPDISLSGKAAEVESFLDERVRLGTGDVRPGWDSAGFDSNSVVSLAGSPDASRREARYAEIAAYRARVEQARVADLRPGDVVQIPGEVGIYHRVADTGRFVDGLLLQRITDPSVKKPAIRLWPQSRRAELTPYLPSRRKIQANKPAVVASPLASASAVSSSTGKSKVKQLQELSKAFRELRTSTIPRNAYVQRGGSDNQVFLYTREGASIMQGMIDGSERQDFFSGFNISYADFAERINSFRIAVSNPSTPENKAVLELAADRALRAYESFSRQYSNYVSGLKSVISNLEPERLELAKSGFEMARKTFLNTQSVQDVFEALAADSLTSPVYNETSALIQLRILERQVADMANRAELFENAAAGNDEAIETLSRVIEQLGDLNVSEFDMETRHVPLPSFYSEAAFLSVQQADILAKSGFANTSAQIAFHENLHANLYDLSRVLHPDAGRQSRRLLFTLPSFRNFLKDRIVPMMEAIPEGSPYKGYSDPVAIAHEVLANAISGSTSESSGLYPKGTPDSKIEEDAADTLQAVGAAIREWLAAHPNATPEQVTRASAYQIILRGNRFYDEAVKTRLNDFRTGVIGETEGRAASEDAGILDSGGGERGQPTGDAEEASRAQEVADEAESEPGVETETLEPLESLSQVAPSEVAESARAEIERSLPNDPEPEPLAMEAVIAATEAAKSPDASDTTDTEQAYAKLKAELRPMFERVASAVTLLRKSGFVYKTVSDLAKDLDAGRYRMSFLMARGRSRKHPFAETFEVQDASGAAVKVNYYDAIYAVREILGRGVEPSAADNTPLGDRKSVELTLPLIEDEVARAIYLIETEGKGRDKSLTGAASPAQIEAVAEKLPKPKPKKASPRKKKLQDEPSPALAPGESMQTQQAAEEVAPTEVSTEVVAEKPKRGRKKKEKVVKETPVVIEPEKVYDADADTEGAFLHNTEETAISKLEEAGYKGITRTVMGKDGWVKEIRSEEPPPPDVPLEVQLAAVEVSSPISNELLEYYPAGIARSIGIDGPFVVNWQTGEIQAIPEQAEPSVLDIDGLDVFVYRDYSRDKKGNIRVSKDSFVVADGATGAWVWNGIASDNFSAVISADLYLQGLSSQRGASVAEYLDDKVAGFYDPVKLAALFDRYGIELQASQAGSQAEATAESAVESATEPQAGPAVSPIEASGVYGATSRRWQDPLRKYEFRYKVVSLDDLVASNDAEGRVNPAYPSALQPRDRSGKSSLEQTNRIAKNLDAETLISLTDSLDSGPPVVAKDNIVEGGNGRVMSLMRARRDNPSGYDSYVSYLKENAGRFGLTEEQVSGVSSPVLVSERVTELSDSDRVKFSVELNAPRTMALSASESAASASSRFSLESLAAFKVGDGENVDNAIKRYSMRRDGIVADFLRPLSAEERNRYVSDTGISLEGVSAVRNALLSSVYDSEEGRKLLTVIVDSADKEGTKRLQDALLGSLPEMAQMKALIKVGARDASYDITGVVARSVQAIREFRGRGLLVGDALAQIDMFSEPRSQFEEKMIRAIDDNMRSSSALKKLFQRYAQYVIDMKDVRQGLLMEDAFDAAIQPQELLFGPIPIVDDFIRKLEKATLEQKSPFNAGPFPKQALMHRYREFYQDHGKNFMQYESKIREYLDEAEAETRPFERGQILRELQKVSQMDVPTSVVDYGISFMKASWLSQNLFTGAAVDLISTTIGLTYALGRQSVVAAADNLGLAKLRGGNRLASLPVGLTAKAFVDGLKSGSITATSSLLAGGQTTQQLLAGDRLPGVIANFEGFPGSKAVNATLNATIGPLTGFIYRVRGVPDAITAAVALNMFLVERAVLDKANDVDQRSLEEILANPTPEQIKGVHDRLMIETYKAEFQVVRIIERLGKKNPAVRFLVGALNAPFARTGMNIAWQGFLHTGVPQALWVANQLASKDDDKLRRGISDITQATLGLFSTPKAKLALLDLQSVLSQYSDTDQRDIIESLMKAGLGWLVLWFLGRRLFANGALIPSAVVDKDARERLAAQRIPTGSIVYGDRAYKANQLLAIPWTMLQAGAIYEMEKRKNDAKSPNKRNDPFWVALSGAAKGLVFGPLKENPYGDIGEKYFNDREAVPESARTLASALTIPILPMVGKVVDPYERELSVPAENESGRVQGLFGNMIRKQFPIDIGLGSRFDLPVKKDVYGSQVESKNLGGNTLLGRFAAQMFDATMSQSTRRLDSPSLRVYKEAESGPQKIRRKDNEPIPDYEKRTAQRGAYLEDIQNSIVRAYESPQMAEFGFKKLPPEDKKDVLDIGSNMAGRLANGSTYLTPVQARHNSIVEAGESILFADLQRDKRYASASDDVKEAVRAVISKRVNEYKFKDSKGSARHPERIQDAGERKLAMESMDKGDSETAKRRLDAFIKARKVIFGAGLGELARQIKEARRR